MDGDGQDIVYDDRWIWCSPIVAATGAAAALHTSYAIGEIVSYKTCNADRSFRPWEYPYDPIWIPAIFAAFFVLAAIMLVWSWRRGGLVLIGIRLFILLFSLMHLYFLVDQTRLYDFDRLLLVSCDGENWKDLEEIGVMGSIFCGIPIFFLVMILMGCFGAISAFFQKPD